MSFAVPFVVLSEIINSFNKTPFVLAQSFNSQSFARVNNNGLPALPEVHLKQKAPEWNFVVVSAVEYLIFGKIFSTVERETIKP